MRKLFALIAILFVLIAIMVAKSAVAEPFVTCDPYPSTAPQPTTFLIKLDASTIDIVSPAVDAVPATAGKRLLYDIGTIPFGNHSVTVRAKNATATSVPSAVFLFGVGIATPGGLIVIP